MIIKKIAVVVLIFIGIAPASFGQIYMYSPNWHFYSQPEHITTWTSWQNCLVAQETNIDWISVWRVYTNAWVTHSILLRNDLYAYFLAMNGPEASYWTTTLEFIKMSQIRRTTELSDSTVDLNLEFSNVEVPTLGMTSWWNIFWDWIYYSSTSSWTWKYSLYAIYDNITSLPRIWSWTAPYRKQLFYYSGTYTTIWTYIEAANSWKATQYTFKSSIPDTDPIYPGVVLLEPTWPFMYSCDSQWSEDDLADLFGIDWSIPDSYYDVLSSFYNEDLAWPHPTSWWNLYSEDDVISENSEYLQITDSEWNAVTPNIIDYTIFWTCIVTTSPTNDFTDVIEYEIPTDKFNFLGWSAFPTGIKPFWPLICMNRVLQKFVWDIGAFSEWVTFLWLNWTDPTYQPDSAMVPIYKVTPTLTKVWNIVLALLMLTSILSIFHLSSGLANEKKHRENSTSSKN